MNNAKYYLVKIAHSAETEVCSENQNIELNVYDQVVVSTRYGKDLGKLLGPLCPKKLEQVKKADEKADIYKILRKANETDLDHFQNNKEKEQKALVKCREMVAKHKLDMKLVSAHYMLDDQKILFFFTADARVDFRELVKDLVSLFKMRIELRQIGVRDESRVLGGIGVCGRVFCCHGLTDHLNPVSIKMAKVQNLSLNSMKISGPCGRLLCCLSYEYDTYLDERKQFPQENGKVFFRDKFLKILDINVLAKTVKIVGPEGQQIYVPLDDFEYDTEREKWNLLRLNVD